MTLRSFAVRGFRNLSPLELEFPRGVVAVLGANGAGKTALLEAVAVFGNLVSFRPGTPLSWVRRGERGFSLAGEAGDGEMRVALRQDARIGRTLHRTLWRGGRRIGADAYLEVLPVVAFSSNDRQFIWGGPEERRRFLDRLAFHLHPETLLIVQRYRRALRQRNALLQGGGGDAELDAFEHDLAILGARLITLRAEGLAALEPALEGELAALDWSLPRPVLRYDAPDGLVPDETVTLATRLRAQLARMRAQERAKSHTVVGPHRHDLSLTVAGAPAREMLSAGQGKLLATACKLAAMAVLQQVRGGHPIVVFDDVDAELDAMVLERTIQRLTDGEQVILSSAHEEMVVRRLELAHVWRMREGQVEIPREGSSLD